MRRATGAVVVALLVATACQSSGKPEATPTPSASPTPTASPTPVVSATAKRLRAIAARTLATCPCSVYVSVTKKGAEDGLELWGRYDPKTGKAMLWTDGYGTRVEITGGRTYVTAPFTRDKWVRLDTSGVPAKARRVTDALLVALADPGLALAMARGVVHPHRNDTDTDAERGYSVTYDLAAVRPGAYHRRLLGEPTPYGGVFVTGTRLVGISYAVLGPGQSDAHGIEVYAAVHKGRFDMPAFEAPRSAPAFKVT